MTSTTESTSTTAAITSTTTEPAGGIVTIWHGWSDSESIGLAEVARRFQEANPGILVQTRFVPMEDLRQELVIAWIAGNGPTLAMGPSDWARGFVENGMVEDLTPYLQSDFLNILNPTALSMLRVGEVLAGVPETIRGVVLFRNRTLVTTELETLSEVAGVPNASFKRGAFFSLGHLTTACNGVVVGPDGLPAFAGSAGVCWLQLVKALPGDPIEYYSGENDALFREGAAPYLVDGTWSIESLTAALGPDVLVIDRFPRVDSGRLSGLMQTEAVYLASGVEPEVRSAALAFVRYLVSVESQTELAKVGRVPVIPGLDVGGLVGQAGRSLDSGTALPPMGGCYWGPLEDAIVAVLSGETEPLAALESAQATIAAEVSAKRCP